MNPTLSMLPVLADAEGIGAVILAIITVIGWIASLISNKNQKGPPVANRPRPPVRPRDDRVQKEISIFLEETGVKRPKGQPARPTGQRGVAPTARSPLAGGAGAKAKPPAPPPSRKPNRRTRPGEDIAARAAPVSDSLGTGVKQSLSQHMNDRVAQEVHQRMAPRVDENVVRDLGPAVAASARDQNPPAAAPSATQAARIAELLRNRASVQQAFALNLILSRPPGLERAPKR